MEPKIQGQVFAQKRRLYLFAQLGGVQDPLPLFDALCDANFLNDEGGGEYYVTGNFDQIDKVKKIYRQQIEGWSKRRHRTR